MQKAFVGHCNPGTCPGTPAVAACDCFAWCELPATSLPLRHELACPTTRADYRPLPAPRRPVRQRKQRYLQQPHNSCVRHSRPSRPWQLPSIQGCACLRTAASLLDCQRCRCRRPIWQHAEALGCLACSPSHVNGGASLAVELHGIARPRGARGDRVRGFVSVLPGCMYMHATVVVIV